MDREGILRDQLIYLMDGRGAHASFSQSVPDFPSELQGVRPEGWPYTAWQLLNHLYIATWDILEFSRDASHVSPEWPEGYWTEEDAPADEAAWRDKVAEFERVMEEMNELVRDPETDLHAPIPHGSGQTILREAMLVADHNAYHLGQMVILRRMLGAWPPATVEAPAT
jgi:uncharacterized damage-inducible protein DinB